MKYKFWRIERFIHQYYDLPLKKFLESWEDKLIEYYYNEVQITKKYNVLCNIKEINEYLDDIITPIIFNNYNVDLPFTQNSYNIYVQDDKEYASVWHNHSTDTASITGVIYISPPKVGGGIEFKNEPFPSITIEPRENILTLFPSWLNHRPLPQKDKKKRICINYSYSCFKRPVHKISGDLW